MRSSTLQHPPTSDSNLIVYDVPGDTLDSTIAALFQMDYAGFGTWAGRVGTSPVKQWYRETARSNKPGLRPLVWKEKKDFRPENIHVRTLDTGRLIPTNTDLGIHMYASRRHWIEVDRKGTRGEYIGELMNGMVSSLEFTIYQPNKLNKYIPHST